MAGLDIPPPRGTGVAFVTGAGGFIGSAAVSAFRRAGWRVAGLGHARRWSDAGLDLDPPDLWVEGDIARGGLAQAAASVGRPELVFHAAGGSSVGASMADPEADRARTVGSLRETLAFLESGAPQARLIYPSSAAIYGEAASGPIPETRPPSPVSPYGRHRALAELLIEQATARFGLQAVVIRFFSVYGPGLRKQLLWELAGRLAASPPELELAGRGDEARDFIFIDDAIRLIGLAAGLDRLDSPLILNGGSGRAASVREAAERLCAAMERHSRVVFNGQVRAGDPRSLVADISRAGALGFRPAVPLEAGMARLARWLACVNAPA